MESLDHPNIVAFKQIFETQELIMIEMEYIGGGQLKSYFERETALTENEVSRVMKSLLDGVHYIHEKDYIHRDLKPENVMISRKNNYNVKIVDFGLSASYKVFKCEKIEEKIGTLIYMAPEQISLHNIHKV